MKFLFPAFLALSPVPALAEPPGASPAQVAVPVDFSSPLVIEIEIAVPSETTPIADLSQYLDKHGFKLHIKVAFKESGRDRQFQSKVLHAQRSGAISPEDFNELSRRISEFVRPFAGNPKWTFQQRK